MLNDDLDGAEDWVRSWTAQVSSRAEAAAVLADRVAGLSASATGADGAIRVTVGSSGVVTGLELDDRVQRMPGRELAAQIMALLAQAQTALTGRVGEVVAGTVGADTETGRAVLDSFARRFPPSQTDPEPLREDRRGR